MKLDNFIKRILTLEIEEFLGICQVMGVELIEKEKDSPKDFYCLVYEVAEKYQSYSKTRKKQLDKILKAATKDASKTKKERN